MSRNIRCTAFLSLILPTTCVDAAILHPLNPLKVIEVRVSDHDLTRIAVQDDRIHNVFGNSGDYSLESDDAQGQVFIRPLKEGSIALTITTESGRTQDLRLVPKDIPSESIILTKGDAPVALANGFNKSVFKDPLHRKEVEDLLKACQEKRIPQGYREIPVSLQDSLRPYPLIRELRGKTLRGLTCKLTAPVSEIEFSQKCGILKHEIVAILMPPHTQSGGYAHVIARTHH